MNKRIKELAVQAKLPDYLLEYGTELCVAPHLQRFAELIIAECKLAAREEIVRDSDIDAESDPLVKEYLKGNNGGVVDSIVAIQQHFFGIEE